MNTDFYLYAETTTARAFTTSSGQVRYPAGTLVAIHEEDYRFGHFDAIVADELDNPDAPSTMLLPEEININI